MGEIDAGAAGPGLRISGRMVSVAAVVVLFMASFFLWTLPFQENPLPFGEGDSAWHFAIGDRISSSDHADFRLPYYVGIWYYGWNRILGPFAPEYLPSNHVNYAFMQVFGGERFVPVLIYRAIASFLGVFAVFFLVSRLFGVLPGFVAGLGIAFSFREQMIFLWGQQPTLVALVILPAVLYAWYSYLDSFYSGSSRPVYLYLTFALLLSQYLLHAQGFLAGVLILGIFSAVMAARHRKLPVARGNLMHYAVAAAAFLVVALPFLPVYIGAPQGSPPVSSFDRLTEWNVPHNLVSGSFPESFVSFSHEYAFFVRGLIFLGIALLFLRLLLVKSNHRELLMFSWLAGLYVIFHLDVVGVLDPGRVARMQVLEPAMFFSLAALAVVWLPSTVSSLLKLRSPAFSFVRYALAAALIVSLVMLPGKASYDSMKGQYGSILRITPAQAEFASWLNTLPEKSYIYDPSLADFKRAFGNWRYPKIRWMLAIGQRYVNGNTGSSIREAAYIDRENIYFMFDYSDLNALASNQNYHDNAVAVGSRLRQVEETLFNNTAPLYDRDGIRLYRYAGDKEDFQV